MPYKIELPDGQVAQFPDNYPREKAQLAIEKYMAKLYPEPPPSAGKQFLKSLGMAQLPTAGGIGGFGAGMAAVSPLAVASGPFAPAVELAGGLGGALLGSHLASKGQQKALEAMPEFAKSLGVDEETMAAGEAAHPISAKTASIVAMLEGFRFQNPLKLLRSKGMTEAEGKALIQRRLQTGANVGIGAGINLGQQATSDQPIDWGQVAESGAIGAFLGSPRRLGKAVENAGRAIVPWRVKPPAAPAAAKPPAPNVPLDPRRVVAQGRDFLNAADGGRAPVTQPMAQQVAANLGIPIKGTESVPELVAAVRIKVEQGEAQLQQLKATGQADLFGATAPAERPATGPSGEQMRLPFGNEQMEMDFGTPPPPAPTSEAAEAFGFSPNQMAFDFPEPAPRARATPDVALDPTEAIKQGRQLLNAVDSGKYPVTQPMISRAAAGLGIPVKGNEPVETLVAAIRARVAQGEAQLQQQTTMGQGDLFGGEAPPAAPPPRPLGEQMRFPFGNEQLEMDLGEAPRPVEPTPEEGAGFEVSPDQTAFDMPGMPISRLVPRDRILRALRIEEDRHTLDTLKFATGLSNPETVAMLNRLKREGMIQFNQSNRQWELTPYGRVRTEGRLPRGNTRRLMRPNRGPGGRENPPPPDEGGGPPPPPQGGGGGGGGGEGGGAPSAGTPGGPRGASLDLPLPGELPGGQGPAGAGPGSVERTGASPNGPVSGEAAVPPALDVPPPPPKKAPSVPTVETVAPGEGPHPLYPSRARLDKLAQESATDNKSDFGKMLSMLVEGNGGKQELIDAFEYGKLNNRPDIAEEALLQLSRFANKRVAELNRLVPKPGMKKAAKADLMAQRESIAREIEEMRGIIGREGREPRIDRTFHGLKEPSPASPLTPTAPARGFSTEAPGEPLPRATLTVEESELPANIRRDRGHAELNALYERQRRQNQQTKEPSSRRVMDSLRRGNLGEALYHLMYEAGGDVIGGKTPYMHGAPSPLRNLAQQILNTFERVDDRSAIIAAEQRRIIHAMGINERANPAEHARVMRNIEHMINNDYDLSKADFTDADGNLTAAGKLLKEFKPKYDRMVEFPRGVKFNRQTGEFVDLRGKRLPKGSFGGAKVVVERKGMRGPNREIIDRLKREGKLAEYDPQTNTFHFTEAGLTDRVVLHEMVHAGTVRVMRQFFEDPKLLTDTQRASAEHINDLYRATKEHLGDKHPDAFENVYEFISHSMTDEALQADLARLRQADLKIPFRTRMRNAWDQFSLAVARMFGYDRKADFQRATLGKKQQQMLKFSDRRYMPDNAGDNALLQMTDAFKDILAVPKVGTKVEPLAARQAPAAKDRSIQELQGAVEPAARAERGGAPKSMFRRLYEAATTPEGRQSIVRNIQNHAVSASDLQQRMRDAGHENSLYDLMTGAASRAEREYRGGHGMREELASSITEYQNKAGIDHEQFMKDAHLFAIARDEADYRRLKFIMKAPVTPEVAARRAEINEKLGKGVSTAEAKALRDELEPLVMRNLDPLGESPLREKFGPREMSVDESSDLYNVAGSFSKSELQRIREFHDAAMREHGPEIDAIFANLKKIQAETVRLNKEAGYHPPQLDGIIEFYRRPNYVPYKGDPNLEAMNEEFDLGGKRLSGNLTEMQNKAEGRNTDSENPLLQVMSDAARAAGRVGRQGLTDEIARLIDNGSISGRKIARIPFNERFNDSTLVSREDLNRPDRVFRTLPDGSTEVYRIDDEHMLEAVKGFTGDVGTFWQVMNGITSGIGKMHTKYNPAFPVYNFVRDAVTSGTFVGADISPAVGARYVQAVTTKVLDGGIFKALKVANLYSKNNLAEIKRLGQSDGFFHTLNEWLEADGNIGYHNSMDINSQYEAMMKDIGPSKVMSKPEHVSEYFQVWSNGFEMASRAAGYSVIKPEVLARMVKANGGIHTPEIEMAARREASQYVKNLFNFAEVGKYGREAGSFFMFLRPSLTTAVRFHKALAPAFQSVETQLQQLPESITNPEVVARNLARDMKANGKVTNTEEAKAVIKALAEQQVQKSMDTYRETFARRQKNARVMSLGLMGAGYALYTMAMVGSDNDEMGRNKVANDNMDLWQRNIRLPIHGILGKEIDYLQLPWGFGFGGFGAFGAQLAGATMGNSTFPEMMKNLIPIAMDTAVPIPSPQYSPIDHPLAWMMGLLTPSFARPVIEFGMNVDTFGREIYTNRMNKFGDPYTGGGTLPPMFGDISAALADNFGIVIEPKTLNFFLNSYADGVSRLGANAYGLMQMGMGDKDLDPKTDILPIASFLGKSSSVDAREFADMGKEVNKYRSRLDMYKDRPEQLASYLRDHPNAEMVVDYYDSASNGALRDARHMINQVERDPTMSYKEKQQLLQELKLNRDWAMRTVLDGVKGYMD